MAKRQLPTLRKGKRLKPHEKIEIAEQVCELYAQGKYTIASCLAEYGIKSESTWAKWIRDIEEIAELYRIAQDKKDDIQREVKESLLVEIKNAALHNLKRMVEGYTVEIVEQKIQPAATDERGQNIPTRIISSSIKQVYIAPHAGLIKYVLNNLDGHYFTNNPEPFQAGNEKYPDKIDIQILGGEIPPVTDEDQIDDIER